MYIKIKNEKIEVIEKNGFWDRFRGLKFVLEPINYAVKFPKRNWFNSNFLCQKVDIVFTDKNENILYMREHLETEKTIFPKQRAHNVYLFPLGTIKKLVVGEQLKIYNKEKV